MSGAAVWVGDRIVGVIAKHHRSDGLGRLATARLDLADLDQARRVELRALLGLPDELYDVVPPPTSERVRTDYQLHVRRIAPEQLLNREAELGELVRFCAGDQPYAWWQAGPWAGKSALMSWFVLHPPSGIDVVSFFVTAREASQSDSHACIAALIEQLAALLGESPTTQLTAGAPRGTLQRLLADAANRSREAGRRLLLVIDGLDEDSGAATGPSIAALLHSQPPPEMRVLVASRPHPLLPDDVADDHPLKTITPRQLDVSEHARSIERDAKNELRQLLTGNPLQRDVLGLITAAGGGLTLPDLEQLTQRFSLEIEHLLGGEFGRSIGGRIGTSSAGYPDERVYLFTHETLRLLAEQQYGTRLAAYRDRLHDWADTYRQRGWPADTPHYLLRSYSRMLASVADLPRLVACGTDQARHNRMRGLIGGDALAFTEIGITQQCILAQPNPDLTALALLAVQRDHLTGRNSEIPSELPAVWARIGQPTRAEGLVNSIIDWQTRRDALCGLVEAVAASGDRDRAARLANEAEAHIGQVEPIPRVSALVPLVEVVAAGGDHDRAARLVGEAEALVGQITESDHRESALARLVGAVAISGDHDRAEALAGQITNPHQRGEALTRLVGAVATGGDHDRAARLAGEAETFIGQIIAPSNREFALIRLVEAMAIGGDHHRAELLAGQITEPGRQAELLAGLAMASGDHDRARRLFAEVEALADSRDQEWARLEEEMSAEDDHDQPRLRAAKALMITPSERTRMLVEAVSDARNYGRAEALIGRITDPDQRSQALVRLVKAVSAGRDYEQVEALIRQIPVPYEQLRALARLATAVAVDGDHDRAARLADEVETRWGRIPDPSNQVWALARLVEAVAVLDDHDRAGWLIDEAGALIGQITWPVSRRSALIMLVEATATSGDYERAARLAGEAEVLIGQNTSRHERPEELARLVGAMAAGGDHDRAARLVAEVEALIGEIIGLNHQAAVMARLAGAVAAGGDHGRAALLANEVEALIGQITYPYQREEALARLVRVVAAGGDHDRAEVLVGQITDPRLRVGALAELVEVTAASGDYERAARLADEAEAHIGQATEPGGRVWALAQLAEVVIAGGDHHRAARLLSEAETLIEQITEPASRVEAMARLAEVLAARGDLDKAARLTDRLTDMAEALVGQIFDPFQNLLLLLVTAVAAGGDHDRAEELIGQIADPGRQVHALVSLVGLLTACAEHDRVARLIGKAEALVGQIDPEHWMVALAGLVEAVAVDGNHDRVARLASEVEALVGQITYPDSRVRALSRLVEVVAACGDHIRAVRLAGEAEALIGQITSVEYGAGRMTQLAAAVASSDHDRAIRLLTAAETLIGQITDPTWQLEAMVGFVEAVAAGGDRGRIAQLVGQAEALLAQITYSDKREWALSQLVGVVAARDEHDRAEALARQMTNPYEQVGALTRLVEAVAVGGDHGRAARLAGEAEALIGQITDPNWEMGTPSLQARALVGLVGAVAAGGDDDDRAVRLFAKAEALIGQIDEPDLRSELMARLAAILVEMSKKTSPVPGHAHSGSLLMVRARHLLAASLVTGSWTDVVVSLARVDPLAVTALADEVQARWGLNAPVRRDNSTLTIRHEAVGSRRAPQWVRGFLRRVWGGG